MDKQNGSHTASSIEQLLNHRKFKLLRSIFNSLEIARISEIFQEIELSFCIPLFRLVPRRRRAEVFSYLPFDRQEELVEQLPEIVTVALLNDMEPVDRTRLLQELPEEISARLIQQLKPEERKMAWQLLSYPEDTVGRIMSPEFVTLVTGTTVAQAIDYIRWNGSKVRANLLHYIFVVDREGKLMGNISLAALVTADPPSMDIDDLMDRTHESISVSSDEGSAVDYFRKFDRPFIPVVDDQDKVVGIVEPDDVFDVAEEGATEDIQAFGGQSTLEDSYFATPFHVLLRKRAGWLSLIFLMSMFTANALEHYDSAIKSMTFLVFFLPLIISSGGNSGSQAASLIIRGLAVREMQQGDWIRVFFREAMIGIGLGSLLGFLGFWRAVWIGGLDIGAGLTVAFTLVAVVTFGAVTGSMLPFLLKYLKLDPAVSSSPVISSVMDIFGIIVLFSMAMYLFSFLA